MTFPLSTTPGADGFYMPGEHAPHAGCWMLWPERPDVWRADAKPAQETWVRVASAIAEFEPVTVGVLPSLLPSARAQLPDHITTIPIAYNDCWMRDNGPSFVINKQGETRGVDWIFNAWGGLLGGLYADWSDDDRVAEQVLDYGGFGRYKAPIVVEGGAIDVDGDGTLILTEQCILNANRNPNKSKAEVEKLFRDYLGVEKVIWIPVGDPFDDETNGHVDNLCCFVEPTVVALNWTDDESHPLYETCDAAWRLLSAETDAKGRHFTIHKIHMPADMHMTAAEASTVQLEDGSKERLDGAPLAPSYINYYTANGGIVAPIFHDPRDDEALNTLQKLYPDRTIKGVYTREVLLGGGNIHCITQQQPLP